MGCPKLDITDYFRLTPTTGNQKTHTGDSVGTSKTANSRFKPVVSVSIVNYRYYSPELGRWLSRDPVGEEGGMNLYMMVGNSPLIFIDYLGFKRYSLNYDFTDDVSWWDKKLNHPDNTAYVKKLADVEADIESKIRKYSPDGKDPCDCIEYIAFTDHSGEPGALFFGKKELLSYKLIMTIKYETNKRKKAAHKLRMQKEELFFKTISKYFCKGATIDFVQCESGYGPQGAALRKYLEEILPEGTNIKLYETNVAWSLGTPKCIKKSKNPKVSGKCSRK